MQKWAVQDKIFRLNKAKNKKNKNISTGTLDLLIFLFLYCAAALLQFVLLKVLYK